MQEQQTPGGQELAAQGCEALAGTPSQTGAAWGWPWAATGGRAPSCSPQRRGREMAVLHRRRACVPSRRCSPRASGGGELTGHC